MSKGGISETTVDVRLLFENAVRLWATALINAHNNPSGELSFSISDLKLTTKIKKTGNNLDIKLLDHLIISEKGYFSFADKNYYDYVVGLHPQNNISTSLYIQAFL